MYMIIDWRFTVGIWKDIVSVRGSGDSWRGYYFSNESAVLKLRGGMLVLGTILFIDPCQTTKTIALACRH